MGIKDPVWAVLGAVAICLFLYGGYNALDGASKLLQFWDPDHVESILHQTALAAYVSAKFLGTLVLWALAGVLAWVVKRMDM